MNDEPISNALRNNDYTFKADDVKRGSNLVGHDEGIERDIGKDIEHYRSRQHLPPPFMHPYQQDTLKKDGSHQWHKKRLAGGIVLGEVT